MAALSVRVLYWTNKYGCAKMEKRHFYSEPCIGKASQAYEDSPVHCFSPEKPPNSHKFFSKTWNKNFTKLEAKFNLFICTDS